MIRHSKPVYTIQDRKNPRLAGGKGLCNWLAAVKWGREIAETTPRLVGVGGDLLSRGPTPRVPSAQVGLTAGFEMGPGEPPPLRPPTPSSRGGVLGEVHTRTGHQNINFSAPRWISPRPLVRVGSTSHDAYTARLSNWSSPSGLTWLPSEESHLEASFPLRCFQRLSLPKVATRPCGWRHNRHTSASSTPVLSY